MTQCDYFVPIEAYRGHEKRNWVEYAPRIEHAVGQMVARYGITSKSILALGGRLDREEYFLARHGNTVTIIDIDEDGDVEPVVAAASHPVRQNDDVRFCIGDAEQIDFNEKFDVLFLSGFAPDEIRRNDLVRQRDTDTYRKVIETIGRWDWPSWISPFHPTVMRLASHLRDGGMMIVQSYYGGFDVKDYPGYLPACDDHLTKAGLTLAEVYRFAQTTGVMLYVIAKDTPVWPLTEAITAFHGRAKPETVEPLRVL